MPVHCQKVRSGSAFNRSKAWRQAAHAWCRAATPPCRDPFETAPTSHGRDRAAARRHRRRHRRDRCFSNSRGSRSDNRRQSSRHGGDITISLAGLQGSLDPLAVEIVRMRKRPHRCPDQDSRWHRLLLLFSSNNPFGKPAPTFPDHALQRIDLFLQTTDHEAFAEFDQINRHDWLRCGCRPGRFHRHRRRRPAAPPTAASGKLPSL